jgi:hypothetical protein
MTQTTNSPNATQELSISLEGAQALARFVATQPKSSWRRRLHELWASGAEQKLPDAAHLRLLRNTIADQLERITVVPPAVRHVGYLQRTRQERFTLKRAWTVNAYRVLHPEGVDLFQPWAATKKEAREVCLAQGILLIE